MKDSLKLLVAMHVFLGPLGVWMIADDAAHPERRDTWYRNPSISIPFCLALEAFIWGTILYQRMKERRVERGLALLNKALQLQQAGHHDAAEAAYQEGRRLTGQK